jgi:dihydromonapterin reductase/dihydrofolate reductase
MKTVLITGASSKIGTELVDYFIANQWKIIYHYHSSKRFETNYEHIDYVMCDFNDLRKVEEKMTHHFQRYGTIDLVVNNASILMEDNEENQQSILTVNYLVPKLINELYAEYYKKGRIINFTDTRILIPNRNHKKSFYYESKLKLHELTISQAQSFGENFLINSIAPGYVHENDESKIKRFEAMPQRNILNKAVNMSDILQAVDLLVRTTSITGQTIAVDCGEAIYKQNERK